jgi:serine acetyltransferase
VSQSNPHARTDPQPSAAAASWSYVPQGPSTLRELWQWWSEDYRAHERDWTRPGFRAVAIHRFGNFRMQLGSKLGRRALAPVYWYCYRYVRNHYGIELPYSVRLGRSVVIEHQGAIVIHGNSILGDGCIVRQGVTLGNRSLSEPFDAPSLGRNVNIGAGAKLLGGIRIGDGAAIGANAVVLTDVPSGATAVGIPAQVLPKRDAS